MNFNKTMAHPIPGYEWIGNGNFTVDAYRHTSCHHELRPGEIWMGNTSGDDRWDFGVKIPHRYAGLKTVRLGEQAYYICGTPISRDYCRPLIIHKSEEDDFYRLQKMEYPMATGALYIVDVPDTNVGDIF